MSNEDIEYYIFEEFDVCAGSFLHENTLSALLEAGLITENIAKKMPSCGKSFLRWKIPTNGMWNQSGILKNGEKY